MLYTCPQRCEDIFANSYIIRKKSIFFIDNIYPSDYIPPVFLRPVCLRPGTNNSRPFFDFFSKGGDYNGLYNG